ncbi:MAG: glycosyltransferase [Candidatus Marinimicrobia bacterium]|nr:glycosyltransferase [Candidatus Neomarinimicrobiota bacterium]
MDNKSLDGSAEMVKSLYPQVILLENTENVGFSRANNAAIRRAKGDHILLLNPDTVVQEDTFDILSDFLETHPEAGAVGCKVLNADGSLQLACRRATPTLPVVLPKILGLSAIFPKSRVFGRYNLTYLDENEISEVDAVSGSCFMTRRDVFEKVGYLDEDFFMYGEDLDWFYRTKAVGFKIYYVPTTKIIHYKGESTRAAGYDAIKMFYKAQIQFVKKHFGKSKSLLTVIMLYIGIILRALVSYAAKTSTKFALVITDIVFMQMSLLLALLLKFHSLAELNSYVFVTIVYTSVWLITLYLLRVYEIRRFSATYSAWAVILGFFVNTTFTFFFKQIAYSREVLIWLLLFNILFLPSWRIAIRLARKTGFVPFLGTLGKTIISRRTAIVGSGEEARRIARKIISKLDQGYKIIGFIDKKLPDQFPENFNYLGNISDLKEIVTLRKITDIIFSADSYSYEEILNIIDRVKDLGLSFKIVPKHMDFIIGKSSVESIEEISLIELHYNIDKLSNRILKRGFDIIFSVSLIILLFPFAIFYWVYKRLIITPRKIMLSPNNRKTMYTLSDNGDISKNRLAGYPLLFNILAGTLSFVGSELLAELPPEKSIHFKPGITGLGQTMNRGEKLKKNYEEYEHYYRRNQSIRLDLEILIKDLFNI